MPKCDDSFFFPCKHMNIIIFFISGGQYGNRLLFASVAVNTTMVLSKTGQTEGLKVYDHWEGFVREKVFSIQHKIIQL